MLVLTRKSEQGIVIGDAIRVTILAVEGGQVRLGIEAPRSVPVHRGEVYQRIQEENRLAASAGGDLIHAAHAWNQRRPLPTIAPTPESANG